MVDPEMQEVLDGLIGVKPMGEMSISELREFIAPIPMELRRPVGEVQDVATAEGIPLRVYRPRSLVSDGALIYFHGGGFCTGSIESHDNVARELCEVLGRVTVSVEYRLAPEYPFPAALDDCASAVRWIANNHSTLGFSIEVGVLLAGDSAGANLACGAFAKLSTQERDVVKGQILAYPVTDHYSSITQSYIDNADGFMLTRDAMITFWDSYLDSAADARNPYATPIRSSELSEYPPTLVLTAEYDPLRDEGEAFAAALSQAGVRSTLVRYDGLIHGFLRSAGSSSKAASALGDIRRWVDRLSVQQ